MFIGCAAVTLLAGGAGVYGACGLLRTAQQTVQEGFTTLQDAQHLVLVANQLDAAVMAFARQDEPAMLRRWYDQINRLSAQQRELVDRLSKHGTRHHDTILPDLYQRLAVPLAAALDVAHLAARGDADSGGSTLDRWMQSRRLVGEAMGATAQMKEFSVNLATGASADAKHQVLQSTAQRAQGTGRLFAYSTAATLIALGAGWLFFGRYLARRLHQLELSLSTYRMEAAPLRIPVKGDDEVSEIARLAERLSQSSYHLWSINRVLSGFADGLPLPQLLQLIVQTLENIGPQFRCAISLVSGLQLGVRRSSPELTGNPPHWRPIWCELILSSADEVLGDITLYLPEPYGIADEEASLVRCFARVAGAAVDRRRAEQTIYERAHFDALTGLPNRALFQQRLAHTVELGKSSGFSSILAFLDLDCFKHINDELGHQIGDQLLCEVAQRLRSCMKPGDTVARLSGDEFTLLLEGAQREDAEQTIAKVLQGLTEPFILGGRVFTISGSIGLTCCPEDGVDVVTLLRNADRAMYAAKRAGRNTYRWYSVALGAEAARETALRRALTQALPRGELRIVFQPVVAAADDRWVIAAETLLRWHHPEYGDIEPGQFIPYAEDLGLIQLLGEWVFRQALQQLQAWRAAGLQNLHLSINGSSRELIGLECVDKWLAVIAEFAVPPNCVTIEITESALLENRTECRERIARLRRAGINIAVDDFGCGYSSFLYIKHYEFDAVKVDKAFVADIETNVTSRVIVEAIVTMARKLGLRVTAEGVENPQQSRILRDLGCDYLQGYWYGEPMSGDAFTELLCCSTRAPTGSPS